MAFKLTTQINVQVDGGQLTTAINKIKQRLEGVTIKVNIEPTSGSLRKLRPAISKKLDSESFPFKVHVTKGSLIIVRRDINKAVSGVKTIIDVIVNPKALKQVQSLNKAINNTGKQAKVTGGLLEKLGKDAALAIRRFGAFTVATSVIFGFIIAVKQAVGEAIQFERQIVKVSQVTGKSIAQLGKLKAEITSLSIEFGVASISLVETARILSQTGLSAKEVTIALRTLAKTQLAPTFGDINKTTEASIAIMRQFGKGAEGLEKQLSAVNAVAGKFAVESDDIATAVRRTGGAFKAAGGNLNELIALFTSVRSTTRESAESIATGFRTIFTRLQRTRTQTFLSKLGIDLQEDGQFVGPLKAIEKLSIALKDIKGTDPRFSAILEELGGFRQISKAIPLIQQFATTRAALNVINKEGATLDRDAALAQQTLAVRIDQTKQEFVALIREISDTATFRAFIDISLKLASALIKIADSIKPLIPLITVFGTIALGRAIGPLAKGFIPGLKGTSAKNEGGLIPGRGPNVDSVAAVLTKGEFVLQRSAVDRIGADNLRLLNAGKFNRGGPVGFAHGGDVDDVIKLETPAEKRLRLSSTVPLDTEGDFVRRRLVADRKKNATLRLQTGVQPEIFPLKKSRPGPMHPDTFNLEGRKARKQAVFTGRGAFGRGQPPSPNFENPVAGNRTLAGLSTSVTRSGQSLVLGGSSAGSTGFDGVSQSVISGKIKQSVIGGSPSGKTRLRGDPIGFVGPPTPPKNFGQIALLGSIALSVASSFNKVDEESSEAAKTFKKFSEAGISAIAQFSALALLLENINLSKGIGALTGVGGKISGGFSSARASLNAPGGFSRLRSRVTGGLRGSFRNSAAGRLSRGKLSGSGLQSSLLKAGAIGIIGSEIGGAIKESGLKDIAKGDIGRGSDKVKAGGVLAGVAAGAAIGSLFGPLGIAVGGVVGGLIGFERATKEAAEAVKELRREKVRENLVDVKQTLASGDELSFPQLSKLASQLSEAGKTALLAQGIVDGKKVKPLSVNGVPISLPASASERSRESNKPGISVAQANVDLVKNAKDNIENIKLQVASGKKFDDVLKEAGISLARLNSITRAAGIDSTFFINAQREVEKGLKGEKEVREALTAIIKNSLKDFQDIQKVRTNLLDVSLSIQEFDKKLAAIRGDTFLPDFSQLFKSAQEGNLGNNRALFNQVLDRTGSLTGASGRRITEGAKAETALLSIAPDIFKVLKTSGALEDVNLKKALEDITGKLLDKALPNNRGQVNNQIERVIASFAGLDDPAIKSLTFEDFNKILASSNVFQAESLILTKAIIEIDKKYIDTKKEQIVVENRAIAIISAGISIRGQGQDAIAKARGGTVSLRQRLQRPREQLGNLLKGTGFGTGASIGQIAAAAQAQNNQIGVTERLTKALQFLRDNTQSAAEIQKSLNLEQNKRKSRLSLAQIQTFGSSSEKRELQREREALKTIRKEGANNVSTKTKERALSFLNRLPTDEANRIKRGVIDRAGFGGPGITKPSAGEEKLIQGLSSAFNQRAQANDALAQIATNTAAALGITATNEANTSLRKLGRNSGGFIPGVGNSDSVDARLTPGEFVIRKESAKVLGPQFLNEMNNISNKSTKGVGAGVRLQEGGLVAGLGDGGNVNLQGVATFNIAVSNFVSGVNTLSSSLDAFPREITGNFRHSIEVIFNGAEIMTRLLPEIQDIALNAAKSELRKFVSEKLPDIGPLD